MSIMTTSAVLIALENLLRGWIVCMGLLRAVLGRVTAIEYEVVDVACAADAVHLFVLVCGGARSVDEVCDEEGIGVGTVAAA